VTLDGIDLFLRILLAAGLGAAVGLERELSDQPAGFRTHILVSLGAALFTVAGAYGVAALTGEPSTRFDPTRVAAQVVTGIGFLGAGAIIQQGVNVRGLTTAASLWVTAAIGLAVGIGYYQAAIVTTVVAIVALVVLKPIERGILRRVSVRRHRLIIEPGESFKVGGLVDHLEAMEIDVGPMNIVREDPEQIRYVISVNLRRRQDPDGVIREVTDLEGVAGAAWYG
jgi:putative Mg2+ transporter-C (MgtC) family protein